MAKSYISEHSAEFSLVPYIKSLLEREFEFVVPIFPWLTREISKESKKLHLDECFYVLAIFARRPKILKSKIYVTINAELQAFQKVGFNYGVSVIAGCPLASNFWELAKCNAFSWIDISAPETYEYLIEVGPDINYKKRYLLTDEQVIDSVVNSRVHNMESFERLLRDTRNIQPYPFYGGRYKPVYFLAKAD